MGRLQIGTFLAVTTVLAPLATRSEGESGFVRITGVIRVGDPVELRSAPPALPDEQSGAEQMIIRVRA